MSLRRRFVTLAAGVVALSVTLVACSSGSGPAPANGSASRATPREAATSASSAPATRPPATHAPTAAQVRARIGVQLDSIIDKQPHGAVSVAALNTATGERYSGGRTSGMWTASSYKLLCLAALLIGRSASSLSDAEVDSAEDAIEHSDNKAGYQLFLDAGGRPGLTSALRTFGMAHTVAGDSDPTFTRSSGADFLKLLQVIDGQVKANPLSKSARSFILSLMGQVETDQRWGVGKAADKGSKFYNKNGWLSIADGNGPGENDDGRWAVTSVGVLTVRGQRVLMAVFTQHQPDFDTGVALVNRLSTLIAPAVAR